jgi:hypothetical protein
MDFQLIRCITNRKIEVTPINAQSLFDYASVRLHNIHPVTPALGYDLISLTLKCRHYSICDHSLEVNQIYHVNTQLAYHRSQKNYILISQTTPENARSILNLYLIRQQHVNTIYADPLDPKIRIPRILYGDIILDAYRKY